ncbi:lipoprotein [Beggiatoa sp. PS]|nr:lipoprotein [Beggiatoa sp. PS]
MYKFFQFSVFLFLASFFTACANLPIQAVAPQVSLSDFSVVKMGFTEQTYRIKMRLQNPNPFPLPISGLNYQLYLNDKEFTRGESNKAISIPAMGEEFLELDVNGNLMKMIGGLQDLQSIFNRALNYRLQGGVNVVKGAPLQMPFEYKGEISLKKLGDTNTQ